MWHCADAQLGKLSFEFKTSATEIPNEDLFDTKMLRSKINTVRQCHVDFIKTVADA